MKRRETLTSLLAVPVTAVVLTPAAAAAFPIGKPKPPMRFNPFAGAYPGRIIPVAGGNFTNTLKIDTEGHVVPSGPAKPHAGETEVEYYIWIQQPDAFMHCEAVLNADGSAWEMKPGSEEYKGRFTPGPAVGSGMATSVRDGKTVTFWWGEQIELTA